MAWVAAVQSGLGDILRMADHVRQAVLCLADPCVPGWIDQPEAEPT